MRRGGVVLAAYAALVSCAGRPDAQVVGVPADVAASVVPLPADVVSTKLIDDRLPPPAEATDHVRKPWPFDIESYDIQLSVNAASHSIGGDVRIDVWDKTDGLSELPLDAVGFEIESVEESTARNERHEQTYQYDGRTLRIALCEPHEVHTKRSFFIRYSAEPKRGLYFNDGPPWQVYTQGEMEDSRYWFPCHDAPDDRATSRVVVNAPAKWRVVGAGRPEGPPEEVGSRAESTWSIDVPHVSYLTTVVAGEYEVVEAPGVVPLWYVVEKEDKPYAAFDFRKTDAVLRFFGDFTGLPYPYPKYSQACVREFMWGGMENISATTLMDRTIHPPEWEPVHSSTSLVAHEAAHQWFGDWITCVDWSHTWLNEGFATYFDLLFTEKDEGRDGFLWDLRGTRYGALGAMDHKHRALVTTRYADPQDLFDGNSYQGGASRLHMLRHLLGDDAFREAIRHYVKARAKSCVTTDDLRAAVEESCGQDLKWFFEQWFEKPGCPTLKIRRRWDAEKLAEVVVVEQTQKGHDVPEAYRLALDVSLGDEVRRLDVTKRVETFELSRASEPTEVRFDPETALLARFDLDETLDEQIAELMHDANPARRLDAAEALARIVKDEKRAAADRDRAGVALLSAFQTEKFAPLRASIGRELASRKDALVADALVAAMNLDADLRVRVAAAESLGAFEKNETVRGALAARLLDDQGSMSDVGETSDLVRAAATSSLAKLKLPGAYELLLGQIERPGWHSHVRDAALRGFGELGDARALPVLVRFAAPGDRWARGAAIETLGKLGKGRPEFRDAVLPYLDDDKRDVRRAAAHALAAMGDPDAVPALLAHFQTEDWPAVKDALRNAVKACRAAAVEAGRLVTTEAARANEIRERHAPLRDEADALAESVKKLTGDAKTQAEARLKALREQMAPLQKDLDALGVPVKPKPKPPAK